MLLPDSGALFHMILSYNVETLRQSMCNLSYNVETLRQTMCNCYQYTNSIYHDDCALISQIFRAQAGEQRSQSPESGNIFLFEIGQCLTGDLVE